MKPQDKLQREGRGRSAELGVRIREALGTPKSRAFYYGRRTSPSASRKMLAADRASSRLGGRLSVCMGFANIVESIVSSDTGQPAVEGDLGLGHCERSRQRGGSVVKRESCSSCEDLG